jgi:hypothetical protein
MTTGNLDINEKRDFKSPKPKKSVNFDTCVRVVLIASRQEYLNYGMVDALWFNDQDYNEFKSTALSELKSVMNTNLVDSRQGLQLLYQPVCEPTEKPNQPYLLVSKIEENTILDTESTSYHHDDREGILEDVITSDLHVDDK